VTHDGGSVLAVAFIPGPHPLAEHQDKPAAVGMRRQAVGRLIGLYFECRELHSLAPFTSLHRRIASFLPGLQGAARGATWPSRAVVSGAARAARLTVVLPEELPVMEFAFPGPLRDRLVDAVLAGTKTTASGLLADYEHEGSPLPRPGLLQAVIDSAGKRVAVIETTGVRVVRLGDVDLAHALARARASPPSPDGGPGMSSSGTQHKCAKHSATRHSPSTTTPWSSP
jgi:ASCH domain